MVLAAAAGGFTAVLATAAAFPRSAGMLILPKRGSRGLLPLLAMVSGRDDEACVPATVDAILELWETCMGPLELFSRLMALAAANGLGGM
jgi:hypothetical protein